MATRLAAAAARRLLPRNRWVHLLRGSRLSSSASTADGLDGGEGGSGRVKIFDRDLKRRHRDRAAWVMRDTDALADAVADNLLDRLEDCRKAFPSALFLGGSAGAARRLLRGRGGIEKLIMMDMSADMVKKWKEMDNSADDNLETHFVVGDEEFLPIRESSQDMIISSLGLHWTNDLPGAMIQCRLALKPDGLFLAAILGGETLKELRIACTIAQMEREGGISPRMSPLAQVRDAGNLLTRAGFNLPGVDVDRSLPLLPSPAPALANPFRRSLCRRRDLLPGLLDLGLQALQAVVAMCMESLQGNNQMIVNVSQVIQGPNDVSLRQPPAQSPALSEPVFSLSIVFRSQGASQGFSSSPHFGPWRKAPEATLRAQEAGGHSPEPSPEVALRSPVQRSPSGVQSGGHPPGARSGGRPPESSSEATLREPSPEVAPRSPIRRPPSGVQSGGHPPGAKSGGRPSESSSEVALREPSPEAALRNPVRRLPSGARFEAPPSGVHFEAFLSASTFGVSFSWSKPGMA
ncbi:hypothetical protein GUJ93_ZPchr0009g2219 [Zizania palustris]|uniref:Methyltransferase type 11 domain-containing protein n=1 Tax=Zizania palustris TaxID=103762 RepID=A0A8J5RL46_ZIZPA|nr:hypothetical protein GUJ93_ZPchr0009g2219 [Zizania palustris]